MALANLASHAPPRPLHLFDSFTDICEPDPAVDGERALREIQAWGGGDKVAGRLIPVKGFYDAMGGPGTLEGNKDLLERLVGYDPRFLHYHVGWFQETMTKSTSVGPIALLRLDGDGYASTKVCLESLYAQIVPGGFVIVDDYGAYDGCRKAVDEFRESRKISAYLHHIDADARYWVKPSAREQAAAADRDLAADRQLRAGIAPMMNPVNPRNRPSGPRSKKPRPAAPAPTINPAFGCNP
jgi:hypothetical protein